MKCRGEIIFVVAITISCFFSCKENKVASKEDFVIGNGQMPAVITDKSGNVDLVYGTGDSIMYSYSADKGFSFSSPSLIAVVPGLFSFATRGPQIAATDNGIVVTACTSAGNIFSYYKKDQDWVKGARVNDMDTVAKEGLMALTASGKNAFAVWLDLRGNKRNKIYGARSVDGGRNWSKNVMVYTSPDTGVCPCCKPSVIMKGKKVFVLFRNWLNGNRDLYLIESSDLGGSFANVQKMGNGSWKLNGCPMDGGGLSINEKGVVQTVWRRKDKIYAASPGIPEKEIGEGRGCAIANIGYLNFYAWTASSSVILLKPDGETILLGKGIQPVLDATDRSHVLCVWENEKQIHGSVISL